MNAAELRASLSQMTPPADLDPLLTALWWDAKGDWSRAHAIAQEEEGSPAAWVHAYLHRKEGDEANAGYWYREAKRPRCAVPLDVEWEQIVSGLLAGS